MRHINENNSSITYKKYGKRNLCNFLGHHLTRRHIYLTDRCNHNQYFFCSVCAVTTFCIPFESFTKKTDQQTSEFIVVVFPSGRQQRHSCLPYLILCFLENMHTRTKILFLGVCIHAQNLINSQSPLFHFCCSAAEPVVLLLSTFIFYLPQFSFRILRSL